MAVLIVRERQALRGAVEMSAELVGKDLWRLTIAVENRTPGWMRVPATQAADRDGALLRSMVSAHKILTIRGGEFVSLIDPFGTIWFIYLLPIFFVVVKATRRVPWQIIWLVGAALEMSHVTTGWVVPDEFAARFVYFYSGYVFSPWIFRFASTVLDRPARLAVFMWRVGGAGDEEFVTVPPFTIILG